MIRPALVSTILFWLFFVGVPSLLALQSPGLQSRSSRRHVLLHASSTTPSRRKILLSRNDPHFQWDRQTGDVEFGATAKLTTRLATKEQPELIREWLANDRAVALSIWDERLMEELRPSIYRLRVMPLQFVTIQLAPSVDMKMQTRYAENSHQPVFLLQSVGFDPHVQWLSGNTAELGIVIEVSGELRASPDGTGVAGRIAFETRGILPAPMRILPEPALKAAAYAINQLVVNFAVDCFEKGATTKYREFVNSKQLQ
jgi:Protein of unknown function (DUF1997)